MRYFWKGQFCLVLVTAITVPGAFLGFILVPLLTLFFDQGNAIILSLFLGAMLCLFAARSLCRRLGLLEDPEPQEEMVGPLVGEPVDWMGHATSVAAILVATLAALSWEQVFGGLKNSVTTQPGTFWTEMALFPGTLVVLLFCYAEVLLILDHATGRANKRRLKRAPRYPDLRSRD